MHAGMSCCLVERSIPRRPLALFLVRLAVPFVVLIALEVSCERIGELSPLPFFLVSPFRHFLLLLGFEDPFGDECSRIGSTRIITQSICVILTLLPFVKMVV